MDLTYSVFATLSFIGCDEFVIRLMKTTQIHKKRSIMWNITPQKKKKKSLGFYISSIKSYLSLAFINNTLDIYVFQQ